ncbi:unnamed protein product, partial [Meganyctiphanes norvegica]
MNLGSSVFLEEFREHIYECERVINDRPLQQVGENECRSQERYTWDCGLACIMMILPETERECFSENFYKICEEEGFEKRTWAIDQTYKIQKQHIRHQCETYRTCQLGPGHLHCIAGFFVDLLQDQDEQRVLNRFHESASRGVMVAQGAVSLDDILNHMRDEGPIIILTNAHLLICDRCAKAMPQLRSCLPCSPPYQGHYIVLVGFDRRKNTIYYRNPSFRDRVCNMSFSALEEARQSYGTDEDIILVHCNTKGER